MRTTTSQASVRRRMKKQTRSLAGASFLALVGAGLSLLMASPTSSAFAPISANRIASSSSASGRRLLIRSPPHLARHHPYQFPGAYSDRFRIGALSASPNNGSESSSTTNSRTQQLFDEYLQKAELGPAVRLLRQHPSEIDISNSARLSHIFQAIEDCTIRADENTDENLRLSEQQQYNFPAESVARQDMTDMYECLRSQNALRLFGAARTVPALAAGSHTVSPAVLEQILDLPLRALTPSSQSTGSVWIAGAVLALAEGLISVGTGIDINTLFLTTLALAFLDRLFLNGAVVESIVKVFNPAVQNKILRHEAGHFLIAYLLGCPVEGIVLSAWDALQDRRFGNRQVSAGTSFFDPQLSQQINNNNNNQQQPSAQITRSSIDRYSTIVMSGIAAEADNYGRADGGAGDEMALVAFLSKLNGSSSSRATTVWDSDAIRNQARWGALQAVLLLREYKPAYEALVEALERGGRLGDCIQAIERAAVQHNLKPLKQPAGYLVDDEASRGMDGRATSASWTTSAPSSRVAATTPPPSSTAAATTTTTSDDQPARPSILTDEESLAVLKEYKTATEKRLQELDERLDEIRRND